MGAWFTRPSKDIRKDSKVQRSPSDSEESIEEYLISQLQGNSAKEIPMDQEYFFMYMKKFHEKEGSLGTFLSR